MKFKLKNVYTHHLSPTFTERAVIFARGVFKSGYDIGMKSYIILYVVAAAVTPTSHRRLCGSSQYSGCF